MKKKGKGKSESALRMIGVILRQRPGNDFFKSVKEQIQSEPNRYPSNRQWQCIQSTYDRIASKAKSKRKGKLESFGTTLDSEFVAIAS